METKALDETRVSMEMSKLSLTMKELQKSLAEKESELEEVKEVRTITSWAYSKSRLEEAQQREFVVLGGGGVGGSSSMYSPLAISQLSSACVQSE